MMSNRPADPNRWRRLIAEFEASGLSQKEFASRHGISSSVLSYWRRRLAREERPKPELPSHTAMAFVALEPVARPTQEPVPLDVNVVGGRTISVWPRFDAAELVRLVRVLEEVGA